MLARVPDQALEYMSERGGLPIAARYLARAVALPPSNTSWYMGLSNGAAGLCARSPAPFHVLPVALMRIWDMLQRRVRPCKGAAGLRAQPSQTCRFPRCLHACAHASLL